MVSIVPPDLKFAVDNISGGDPYFVGVKWYAPGGLNPLHILLTSYLHDQTINRGEPGGAFALKNSVARYCKEPSDDM